MADAPVPPASLFEGAKSVLETADPRDKAAMARAVAAAWREKGLPVGTRLDAPDRPSRPADPQLVPPGQVPRRRLGTPAGRAALLHAIAHIELNAIDLAFDMLLRFGADPLIAEDDRAGFLSDWISVGDDEARHFILVEDRLNALDSHYGALPAHDGLWDAALATADSLPARLAIAPLVLEARGLDVTPGMINRLESTGDAKSAGVLKVIYNEEIGHVATGMRWFLAVSATLNQEPEAHFHALVTRYFKGHLKPPFNIPARLEANFPPDYYEPLT
ncbi:ferritin-like domain-containing protein [Maricaulis alexandrii]|uniref:ferritin-like domain-containing protein n=1 Tax=Maricaulis alexandrii TaxID=2570354 RepID=UPI0011090368|nr:ferritin-like domain-containing protein [Maricaulis alexandrii]